MGNAISTELIQEIASLSIAELEVLERAISWLTDNLSDEAYKRSKLTYDLEYDAAWEKAGVDDVAEAVSQARRCR